MVNRPETRMDTGLGELFLCIKFREPPRAARSVSLTGPGTGVTLPPPEAHTQSPPAPRQVPRHAQED